ncbi:hypothetical protein ARMA_2740 [Ardenticatena maritima]|uniref:Uncharacterized protein n=1 Tax=Ardenticatena maritima TaxID=872965 RepID=A0A0M9UDT7_9CHLR|nr:hypothetical protein [Ardenticatena maritima]GAP64317.1 hypothetical protein ARMA_2740 [Ardenticatena maritima]
MARKQGRRRARTQSVSTQPSTRIEMDYTHVKHDLTRIAILSALIFGGQVVLWFFMR